MLKGKPSERLGRKATGLSPLDKDIVAGLIGKPNNKCNKIPLLPFGGGFFYGKLIINSPKGGTTAHNEITSLLVHKAKNNSKQGNLAMINGINAATPAPNAFPDVDNNNNGVQKNQEEVSNVQAEETSNVNSTRRAEHNEKSSNFQAEETVHVELAQRENEANTEPPAAQNESPGTILDILG